MRPSACSVEAMSTQSPGPLERETTRDLVLPKLAASGWQAEQIIREYPLRASRTLSLGDTTRNIGDGFADIVLEATPGTPVAVVEVKRESRSADDAFQQAIRYSMQLDAPLAYGTNGHEIRERNLVTGKERVLSAFPPAATMWAEYSALHHLSLDQASLIAEPFDRTRITVSGDVLTPRPYQMQAINRVLAAIARGERRVLLLMATGTGKTFTAMQLVSKLRSYERAIRPMRNYRVLYLADRDSLVDQPMRKDFVPVFGGNAVKRVLGQPDMSREIYFASYQALVGNRDAEQHLQAFRSDFFDLVIVDECHRGSAEEDSSWRQVLDYFSSAVQLGLTATPRDDTVHSYEYFGNPVFEYSLRNGIEDGYLAPYRVRRVALSPDVEGWEPSPGETDLFGNTIPEGRYSTRDFERAIVLRARTRLAARHLSKRLREHPRPRAIVFCVNVEHAGDMRAALAEENSALLAADPEWVVRIVGTEPEKTRLIENLCNPTRTSPAVVTTSRLLSTGVDVEDLTHVVLFRPVGSMIEFKQIVGRGTRLYPDAGKVSFEIIDYVGASEKFNDPTFDGYPVEIVVESIDDDDDGEPGEDTAGSPGASEPSDDMEPESSPWVAEPVPPFICGPGGMLPGPAIAPPKYYVDREDFDILAETQLVPDAAGGQLKLTEYGAFVQRKLHAVGDADELRRRWAHVSTRRELRTLLEAEGVRIDEVVAAHERDDIDPLDALVALAWNQPMRTRNERAKKVRESHAEEIEALSALARTVLEGLLSRYEKYGIGDLETPGVYQLDPLYEIGSVTEIAEAMGGAPQMRAQLAQVQEWLYSA